MNLYSSNNTNHLYTEIIGTIYLTLKEYYIKKANNIKKSKTNPQFATPELNVVFVWMLNSEKKKINILKWDWFILYSIGFNLY